MDLKPELVAHDNGYTDNADQWGLVRRFRCKLCGKVYHAEELDPAYPDICQDPACPGEGKRGKILPVFVKQHSGTPANPTTVVSMGAAPSTGPLSIHQFMRLEEEPQKTILSYKIPFRQYWLFWCAGIVKSDILHLGSDKLKYQSLGLTIIFAGLLSSLSGGYALYYVFYDLDVMPRFIVSCCFGLLWGFIILNIDRSVIIGFNADTKLFKKLLFTFPRLVLAIVISFIIAVPLELQIFKGPIELAIGQKLDSAVQVANKLLTADMDQHLDRRKILSGDYAMSSVQIDSFSVQMARENEIKKNNNGQGPRYMRFMDQRNETIAHRKEIGARIKAEDSVIAAIQQKFTTKTDKGIARAGFASLPERISILSDLAVRDQTIYWMRWLVQLLFILVECFPILMKLFYARGAFDDYKLLHDKDRSEQAKTITLVNEAKRNALLQLETEKIAAEAELYRQRLQAYKSPVL